MRRKKLFTNAIVIMALCSAVMLSGCGSAAVDDVPEKIEAEESTEEKDQSEAEEEDAIPEENQVDEELLKMQEQAVTLLKKAQESYASDDAKGIYELDWKNEDSNNLAAYMRTNGIHSFIYAHDDDAIVEGYSGDATMIFLNDERGFVYYSGSLEGGIPNGLGKVCFIVPGGFVYCESEWNDGVPQGDFTKECYDYKGDLKYRYVGSSNGGKFDGKIEVEKYLAEDDPMYEFGPFLRATLTCKDGILEKDPVASEYFDLDYDANIIVLYSNDMSEVLDGDVQELGYINKLDVPCYEKKLAYIVDPDEDSSSTVASGGEADFVKYELTCEELKPGAEGVSISLPMEVGFDHVEGNVTANISYEIVDVDEQPSFAKFKRDDYVLRHVHFEFEPDDDKTSQAVEDVLGTGYEWYAYHPYYSLEDYYNIDMRDNNAYSGETLLVYRYKAIANENEAIIYYQEPSHYNTVEKHNQMEAYFYTPADYDGAVFSICSHELPWEADNHIYDFKDAENLYIYRLCN